MAERPLQTIETKAGRSFWWETITATDTGEPLWLPKGGAQISVYMGGTFGGTVSMQGTIDGDTWFTILDSPGGSPAEAAAAGHIEISTSVKAIRPIGGTGVSDVDVYVSAVA